MPCRKIFLLFLFFLSTAYATPLHQALIDINEAKVRLLVKEGSDVNAVDKNGKTPLHLASAIGRYSIVKFLVEKGADPYIKDNEHKTALVYAIEKNRIKVIMYLSAKVNRGKIKEENENLFSAAKNGKIQEVAFYLNKHDINDVNEDGKTALHMASEAGQFEIAVFLLKQGADAKLLDHDGRSALNYAKLSGNIELIKLLTQK